MTILLTDTFKGKCGAARELWTARRAIRTHQQSAGQGHSTNLDLVFRYLFK